MMSYGSGPKKVGRVALNAPRPLGERALPALPCKTGPSRAHFTFWDMRFVRHHHNFKYHKQSCRKERGGEARDKICETQVDSSKRGYPKTYKTKMETHRRRENPRRNSDFLEVKDGRAVSQGRHKKPPRILTSKPADILRSGRAIPVIVHSTTIKPFTPSRPEASRPCR
jgi:hypothetical protein